MRTRRCCGVWVQPQNQRLSLSSLSQNTSIVSKLEMEFRRIVASCRHAVFPKAATQRFGRPADDMWPCLLLSENEVCRLLENFQPRLSRLLPASKGRKNKWAECSQTADGGKQLGVFPSECHWTKQVSASDQTTLPHYWGWCGFQAHKIPLKSNLVWRRRGCHVSG